MYDQTEVLGEARSLRKNKQEPLTSLDESILMKMRRDKEKRLFDFAIYRPP